MREFSYEIKRHIATLRDQDGYSLQVNIISYNKAKPKLDIRNWKGEQMFKGITLSKAETEALLDALCGDELEEMK